MLIAKAAENDSTAGYGRHARTVTEQDIRARMIFGVSTGTLDDKQAAAFEQGCPKVSKRIESLHWLQDEGFRTYGMICPTLPMRHYAQFTSDMLAAIRVQRCEHVWAEVINVRGESMTRTAQALHSAGYEWQAAELQRCAADSQVWEHHAQETFLNLVERMGGLNHTTQDGRPRLRFLQYVHPHTLNWWKQQVRHGAVLLGHRATSLA